MRRAVFRLLMILIMLGAQSALAEDFALNFREKLENGQNIVLKDSTISDNLILRNSDLIKDSQNRIIVNSSLEFVNCEIKGDLSFGSAIFKKPLIFENTKFSGKVNFANSKFASYCSFNNAEFKKSAIFDGANFSDSDDFINAQFENTASFRRAFFSRPAYFRTTKFFEDVYFREAVSLSKMDFEEAEFHKSAIFSQANFGNATFQATKFFDISEFNDAAFDGESRFVKSLFGSDANFDNISFRNRANFYGSKFQDIAKFPNSIFKSDAIFTGCKFQGPADFSSANFSGISNFEGVEFYKIVKFNKVNFLGNASFFGAYFDKDARFEGASFGSRLNLSEATFSQLAVSWEAIRGHLVKDKGANLSLISNYKSLGWIKDRNQCYYDYRDDRRTSSEWGLSRIMDSASCLYWGYGVRPYNAIISISIIILLFGLIYKGLIYLNLAKVVRKSGREDNKNKKVLTLIKKTPSHSKAGSAIPDSSKSGSNSISLRDSLTFSARTLLLRSSGDIQIEGMYAKYAMWIQKTIFGFFVALFFIFLNPLVIG